MAAPIPDKRCHFFIDILSSQKRSRLSSGKKERHLQEEEVSRILPVSVDALWGWLGSCHCLRIRGPRFSIRALVQLVDLQQVRRAEALALAHGALHDRLDGHDGGVGILVRKLIVKQSQNNFHSFLSVNEAKHSLGRWTIWAWPPKSLDKINVYSGMFT